MLEVPVVGLARVDPQLEELALGRHEVAGDQQLPLRGPQVEMSQAEGIHSLAVLPLDNLTGDPEQDYYVDGLQDLLISELSQLSGLGVTSRQSTKRYRDSQLPAPDIAKELGVDALVEGSLLRDGSKIEVSIQLIHGRSDEHLWAARYARDTSYVLDLVS